MPLKTMTNVKNEETKVLIDTVNIELLISPKDSIKNQLIEQVENYIYKSFPKTHKTIPTSIVEIGLEKNVDILFMMAQTQIETSFGTAGAGRESSRRSLFGVAKRRYGTYDEAINDYVALLKKSYLTRGRTEQDLMRRYTTISGYKYAGNPNYEAELRNAYSNIKRKTKIKELQNEYMKL
jgi:flagellum-specific peptidoglycan hydrolase FlgJ